ncbi:MAG TPA: F0F1 ATP synthase subunit A [Chryseosolibacter sp.]|nr:F0F1 ATP synthase subunit A [Chryseosolibacter sp.]
MTAFSYKIRRFSLVLTVLFSSIFSIVSQAQDAHAEHADEPKEELNVSEVIIHHVLDDHSWHISDNLVIPLPIIVYSKEKGLDIFSSSNFYNEDHQVVPYNGYELKHNHIYLQGTENTVLDLSITKNVAMLLINAALLLIVFVSVANAYKRGPGRAPRGLQSFMEPIILFVKDEIVKPNIGHNYEKFLPYMLTLFFFILFGNLLGLLPGAGNLTGNIAVTMTLALLTFIITNVSGNKGYWKHIFWTPGVPLPLRLVILPVEIVGIFTRPFSLMIRLFVAITAGHIVLLSLICLAFIFNSYLVGGISSLIVLFINLIEILVAGIQAYVFTLFSCVYVGMATAEEEHH